MKRVFLNDSMTIEHVVNVLKGALAEFEAIEADLDILDEMLERAKEP